MKKYLSVLMPLARCIALFLVTGFYGVHATPGREPSVARAQKRQVAKEISGKTAASPGVPASVLSALNVPGKGAAESGAGPANLLAFGALPSPRPQEYIPGKSGLDFLFGVPGVGLGNSSGNIPLRGALQLEQVDLLETIALALDFSREVKAANARVDQADSQSGQAGGYLLPNISYRRAQGQETSAPASLTDPVTGGPKASDTHTRVDDAVVLRQPLIDVAGFSEWRRRKNLYRSRAAALMSSRGDEYLASVQAYLGLVSTRLAASLAQDYEKQLEQLLEYISRRAEAGAATNADMQRVQARALMARASRFEQEAAQEAALVEFTRLTNAVPKMLRLPRLQDLPADLPASLDEALPLALENNPEVASLMAERKAAEWDKLGAKSRFAPRLDFELTDQRTENAGGKIGQQHDRRAMVVLSWTPFAGGTDYYYHRERISRLEEISWRLDDQQRRLFQGLSAQYAVLESTRSRLAAGYRELAAIAEAVRAMSERMLAGNTSLLDLLDVQERLYQIRSRLVVLHTQEITAAAQITRYLGKAGDALPTTRDAAASGNLPYLDYKGMTQ